MCVNKVTLIIPTHERHNYLERIIDYYINIKSVDFDILIADSSIKAFREINSSGIKYFHMPRVDLMEKLSTIVELSRTSYTLICADDDFIIPSTIYKCVDFLDQNNDYASVQGKYLSFINIYGFIFFQPYYIYNYKMNVHSDDIQNRLIEQFSPYMHQSYSVFRTKELKEAYKIFRLNIKDYSFLEFSVAINSAINGKHKIINSLYSIRESIFTSSSSSCISIHLMKEDINHKDEYNNFLNMHAKKIISKNKIDFLVAKKFIIDAIDKYVIFLKDSKDIRTEYSYKEYMDGFEDESTVEADIIKKLIKKHNIPNPCNRGLYKCIYYYLSILMPIKIKNIIRKFI